MLRTSVRFRGSFSCSYLLDSVTPTLKNLPYNSDLQGTFACEVFPQTERHVSNGRAVGGAGLGSAGARRAAKKC